jgi:hypothetical protein
MNAIAFCIIITLYVIVLILAYREICKLNEDIDSLEEQQRFFAMDYTRLSHENMALRVKLARRRKRRT